MHIYTLEEAIKYLYDNDIISTCNYSDLLEDLEELRYYENHFYDEDEEGE